MEEPLKNANKHSAIAPKTGTKQYHIQCEEGDVASSVLMPGDPDRVPLFAKSWNTVNDLDLPP